MRRDLARGELVRLTYRLGRHGASGVLTIRPRVGGSVAGGARPEVFVLRRGLALDRVASEEPAARAAAGAGESARRSVSARLTGLAGAGELSLVFEGGVTAVMPPGASHGISLAAWARAHLEQQLDGAGAEALVRRLAGAQLSVRPELAPEPADEADRRMLAAMAQPRRLDQIWPLARTPRFRLLAFLHFLRAVDALEAIGVAAERSGPVRGPARGTGSQPRPADPGASPGMGAGPGIGSSSGPGPGPGPGPSFGAALGPDARRRAALRMLGVDAAAEPNDVKRAYRRLARALHPDLQPGADAERRRVLERRFAEVTAAYEALV